MRLYCLQGLLIPRLEVDDAVRAVKRCDFNHPFPDDSFFVGSRAPSDHDVVAVFLCPVRVGDPLAVVEVLCELTVVLDDEQALLAQRHRFSDDGLVPFQAAIFTSGCALSHMNQQSWQRFVQLPKVSVEVRRIEYYTTHNRSPTLKNVLPMGSAETC